MRNLFIPNKQNNYKPYLLRKVCLVIYTIILVAVNSFGGLFGISKAYASSITPENIIALSNQERTAAGLNTLTSNSKLAAAAMAKAQDMFEKQYWDHFGPNGETPWQFIIAQGYNYVYAGENLAKGFRTAEGVIEAWMASPTHKENLLSRNYKDIGIAVMDGVLLGKQTTLVVQMFGNLTNEVQGSASTTLSTPTPVVKTPVIDSGQIKSISITHPRTGDILKDPVMLVQGSTEGDKDDYTVEIIQAGETLAEVDSNSHNWEISSSEKWSDGTHSIYAQVKGTNVKSNNTDFIIDTVAPIVLRDTIQVKNSEDNYTLSFSTDEDWYEIRIVNGDTELKYLNSEVENIELTNFIPNENILLYVSDSVGNETELDISEYFVKGTSDSYSNVNLAFLINSLGTSDGINIIVVSFILILILIEVYILWKKGKLGKNIGDLFVVGLWITILTIGIFKGFGGITV
jgi:hypothetical protein